MAHLLEQQHLLRQEFTATPDSAITINTSATNATTTHSNSSSLSPSIEQVIFFNLPIFICAKRFIIFKTIIFNFF